MSEETIQRVEEFCDLLEQPGNIPIFTILGKTLSIPASVAAVRAFYFVESKYGPVNEKYIIYECIRYILTDERSRWNTMSDDEKIALLGCIGGFKVLVLY